MKIKSIKTPKPKPDPEKAEFFALGREIYEAALKYRREAEGFNDGSGGWAGLNHWQKKAWEGVGIYVSANFQRLTPAAQKGGR